MYKLKDIRMKDMNLLQIFHARSFRIWTAVFRWKKPGYFREKQYLCKKDWSKVDSGADGNISCGIRVHVGPGYRII